MRELNYYVYGYYEPECSVPFYVGKGKNNRSHSHLINCYKKRTPFHNKLRKLLEDGYIPEIHKLRENLSETEAFQAEMEFILLYGRRNIGTGPLLNLTDGGEGTTRKVIDPEQRKRISENLKGNKGTAGFQNAKGTISPNRKRIGQYYYGVLIKEYDFIEQVKQYGLNSGNVSSALTGTRKMAHGCEWKYL